MLISSLSLCDGIALFSSYLVKKGIKTDKKCNVKTNIYKQLNPIYYYCVTSVYVIMYRQFESLFFPEWLRAKC